MRSPPSDLLNLIYTNTTARLKRRETLIPKKGTRCSHNDKNSKTNGTGQARQADADTRGETQCDDQSLASLGRWPVEHRTYPEGETWRFVSGLHTVFSRRVGTPALLTSLRAQQSLRCVPPAQTVSRLSSLAARGFSLTREEGDREDIPLAFRYLDLLLRCIVRDPEVALGSRPCRARRKTAKTPGTVPSEEKVES